MAQWSRRLKRRSRRRRFSRARVLRIDILETRRLLCSSLFECAPASWNPGDDFEDHELRYDDSEHGDSEYGEFERGDSEHEDFDRDQVDVRRSGEAEGEPFEFEDQADSLQWLARFSVPSGSITPPVAETSAAGGEAEASDSSAGINVVDAGQIAAPVVRGTINTKNDDQSGEQGDSETGQVETPAAKAVSQQGRESTEDSESGKSGTSPSRQAATTSNFASDPVQPGEADSATPQVNSANPAVDATPGVDESNQSFPNDNVWAGETAPTIEWAISPDTGGASQGDSSTEAASESASAETVDRDAPREAPNGENQRESSADRTHDAVFTEMASESSGSDNWRVLGALSPDLPALEAALRHLLANRGQLGDDAAGWMLRPEVLPWALAATIGLIAAETCRRRANRARWRGDVADPESEQFLLRLFPELLGVPVDTPK